MTVEIGKRYHADHKYSTMETVVTVLEIENGFATVTAYPSLNAQNIDRVGDEIIYLFDARDFVWTELVDIA